ARKRGPVIKKISKSTGTSKRIIYLKLRRYWQGGQRKNTLLPRYENSGARGSSRKDTKKKRGRPRTLTRTKGAPPGVNVSEETKQLFRLGVRAFYTNKKNPIKRSLKEAYSRTLERFFNKSYDLGN